MRVKNKKWLLGIAMAGVLLMPCYALATNSLKKTKIVVGVEDPYESAGINTKSIHTEKIRIADKEYSKSELIWDFTKIAFSNALWFEDTVRPFWSIRPVSEDINPWHEGKWYEEYMFRRKGLPRHNTIYKWTSEITIGIGWPDEDVVGFDEHHEVISKQIASLVPKIEELTGLPVRFIDRSDLKEGTEDDASIRIVPIKNTGVRNYFKTFRGHPKTSSHYKNLTTERSFKGTVRFTQNSRSQVEGYLLPNADNSLGMAVCKVLPVVGQEMLKALISECLFRALGLPELSKNTNDALAGNWNKSHDGNSKRTMYDDKSGMWWPSGPGKSASDAKERNRFFQNFPNEITDKNRLYFDFQPYDELMVSLLYCPAIKAGMDKYQVIDSLIKNETCFKETN